MALVILIIAFIYFVIILWISLKLILNPEEPRGLSHPVTKVSVIVPARNEGEGIKMLLIGLLKQDYPRHLLQIIVVDDASEDNTVYVIEDFIRDHPDLDLVLLKNDQGPSKKRAMETAVNAASGTLILTTDADCRIPPTWVSSITHRYEKCQPVMILGPVAFSNDNGFFTGLQSLEFMGLMGATAGSAFAGRPLMCNAANLAFTKTAFLECGGFSGNEKYASGDDQFLMMKMRKHFGKKAFRFNFQKDAVVLTNAEEILSGFLHQRLRWVSKNKGYRDWFVTGVAVVTWLFNVAILASLCIPGLSLIGSFLFLMKMMIDLIPTMVMADFFEKRKLLMLYPVAAVLNVFYTVFIGIAGMVMPYNWKGVRRTS